MPANDHGGGHEIAGEISEKSRISGLEFQSGSCSLYRSSSDFLSPNRSDSKPNRTGTTGAVELGTASPFGPRSRPRASRPNHTRPPARHGPARPGRPARRGLRLALELVEGSGRRVEASRSARVARRAAGGPQARATGRGRPPVHGGAQTLA